MQDFQIPPMPQDHETVLVLAGDVRNDRRALGYVLRNAERFRAVIYVLGNHEYYKESFGTLADRMTRDADQACDNVHVLENRHIDIDNVRFIGATLWSDFNRGENFSLYGARLGMNDFQSIRTGPAGAPYVRRLSPREALLRHLESRGWLADAITLAHQEGKVAVVVTHHGPTLEHEDPEYRGSGVSGAYVSDMADFITRHQPCLWVSGHTHHAVNMRMGTTTMISNPRGYSPRALVPRFDPFLSVVVAGGRIVVRSGRPVPEVINGRSVVRGESLPAYVKDLLLASKRTQDEIEDAWLFSDVQKVIDAIIVGTRQR